MAKLRLDRRDIHRLEVPKVCAVCGKPSEFVVNKSFRWSPEWVSALILCGALFFAILLIVGIVLWFSLAKTMVVPVPLCRRHRRYWFRRTLWIYVPVTLTIIAAIAEFSILFSLPPYSPNSSFVGYSCGATALLFFVALVVAAVMQRGTIRANEMTDDRIEIGRLNKDYVAAMEEERRRVRFGDPDDDFDRPIRRRRAPVDDRREIMRPDDDPLPPDGFRAGSGNE